MCLCRLNCKLYTRSSGGEGVGPGPVEVGLDAVPDERGHGHTAVLDLRESEGGFARVREAAIVSACGETVQEIQ